MPKCSRIHPLIRALERYGLVLGEQHLKEICKKITDNEAKFLGSRGRDRQEWELYYLERKMRVIYDTREDKLRTIIPPLIERPFTYLTRRDKPYKGYIPDRHNHHFTKKSLQKTIKKIESLVIEEELQELGVYDATE